MESRFTNFLRMGNETKLKVEFEVRQSWNKSHQGFSVDEEISAPVFCSRPTHFSLQSLQILFSPVFKVWSLSAEWQERLTDIQKDRWLWDDQLELRNLEHDWSRGSPLTLHKVISLRL